MFINSFINRLHHPLLFFDLKTVRLLLKRDVRLAFLLYFVLAEILLQNHVAILQDRLGVLVQVKVFGSLFDDLMLRLHDVVFETLSS